MVFVSHIRPSIALCICVTGLAFLCPGAFATEYYVWANSPSDGPGTNWATAFHVIQDAVDRTADDDTVLVTNGVYDVGGALTPGHVLTNRVCITNAITVQSVNGRDHTFIVGAGDRGITNDLGAVRCVFIAADATLSGFTLTNGHTRSGHWLYDRCGGGVLCVYGGTLSNCTLNGNWSYSDGGGAACYEGGTLNNCTLSGNYAYTDGGGAVCYEGGTLNNCTLSSNEAAYAYHSNADGGGAHLVGGGTLNNCTLSGNFAHDGGGVGCYFGGTLNNCTLSDNTAYSGGGAFCDEGGTLNNCIIWSNMALAGNDILPGGASTVVRYTCASDGLTHGVAGCITNDPRFVDAGSGDYRLSYGSPCIDTGSNGLAQGNTDLGGYARILDGDDDGTNTVDMGVYEYDSASYDSDGDGLVDGDELDTYGTSPTNTNTDGDPHTDYEEMIADTDGADSNDYFRIAAISDGSPFTAYFESSSNRWYTMDYCSNLLHGVWTNVPGAGPRKGQHGTDSMSDTNNPLNGPSYRMRVGLWE